MGYLNNIQQKLRANAVNLIFKSSKFQSTPSKNEKKNALTRYGESNAPKADTSSS
jgi:hypothetical protein